MSTWGIRPFFIRHLLVGCMLLSGLWGCGPSTTEKLTLTGSSTIAPLASELAREFEARHPNVRVDVQTGGSSRGIADARSGVADIGMASRPLNGKEMDLFAHEIAYDGIALILNTENPVDQLTDQDIVAIYSGEIDNWRLLGGPDQAITVVNKAEGRSTLELFLKYFKLNNKQVKADIIIGDNQQGIKTVAGSPAAIGYVSIGTAEFEVSQNTAIKILGLGGIAATISSVKSGDFPLSRPLNLVTSGPPEGWSKKFIEFAQSDSVHSLVKNQFFIPVNAH
ncbi:phosphate ABC transporter substrate-binding protein [Motiliproteus sp. MSK22-1]|uniref:phosphate ABC transporter substrate-binding protein n=1 Tax=Motiliproteus sp. MSK22-1 TaxID=1897630 RepID=UPI0009755432|nr:phosphate ABC transporter substrate-binding protein [Motiliproteus sp. MSK22-1]OMH26617.1 ABC transporter substrate-binding protein [Motiliproteus sp. MSK22-1]